MGDLRYLKDGEKKGSALGVRLRNGPLYEVDPQRVCVLLLQDLLQSCARGGRRRVEDMCYDGLVTV